MIFFIPTTPVLATANDIMFIYKACDPLVQAICVLLLLVSLAVWIIMLDKVLSLHRELEANRRFLRIISDRDIDTPELREKAESSDSLAATVYLAARMCLDSLPGPESAGAGCHTRSFMEYKVRAAMDNAIKRHCDALNRRGFFLKTVVVNGLCLGVFGLLWGIMIAFARFAAAGCSDIQPLANGVSGALLPLTIACLAAFPAFAGTRLISSRIGMIAAQLDLFAEKICTKMPFGQDWMPEEGFIVRSPDEGKAGFVRECCHAVTKKGKIDADGIGKE
jgi:biopolymer transport protein ExbB